MHRQRLHIMFTLVKRFKSTEESTDVTYYIPPKTFRPAYYHPMKPSERKPTDPFPPFPVSNDFVFYRSV